MSVIIHRKSDKSVLITMNSLHRIKVKQLKMDTLARKWKTVHIIKYSLKLTSVSDYLIHKKFS